jgi:hypothetical protein
MTMDLGWPGPLLGPAHVGGTNWRMFVHCRELLAFLDCHPWLDLHLVCTNGVPVADMLSHSPHLPLIIYYHPDTLDPREMTE